MASADLENGYTSEDETFNAFSEKKVRAGFIRKVYSILSLQLLITFGFVAVFQLVDPIRNYVLDDAHSWMFFTALGISLVLIIVLICIPGIRRSFPTNLICLMLFTICESFLVAIATCGYQSDEVLQAVGYTVIIFVLLTLFAFQTKIDFTLLSGLMLTLLLSSIFVGIAAAISNSPFLNHLYAGLGIFIFSSYIVIDTQLMMGNHSLAISPEEYVFAALSLYLDIINLFMMMLRCMNN